jgi:molybdate transport system permease protein
MTADDWQLTWFTGWVSALSTLLILPPGLLLAWLLARREWRGKSLVETCVLLPMVMPPVATGLILLKILGRRGPIGAWMHSWFGADIVFTWRAVLIALGVMSFPLLVLSARTAFEKVNPRLEQIAQTLGAGPVRIFFTVTAPLAARGIAGGIILAFARALGEFGATIMVAGNIPGRTSTLSLSIFQSVEMGDDSHACTLLAISTALAFIGVWMGIWFLRRQRN